MKFMLADRLKVVTPEEDIDEVSKGKQLEIGNAKSRRSRSKIFIISCKDANHKHIVKSIKAEQSSGL